MERATDIELLTVKEACDLLKVSRRTVYRYIETGLLKCVRFNSRTQRIYGDSVRALLTPADES